MNRQRGTTLYNLIFPVWMLWLFPLAWIVVLPANFFIDLAVVALTLRALHVAKIKENAKAVILRVWGMGFVADFIGTALMFLALAMDFNGTPLGAWWHENITNAVSYNAFGTIFSFLWVTLSIAVSGLCIYWLNLKFCLKKADLTAEERRRLALSIAVFTAPYLFYLPTAWFY